MIGICELLMHNLIHVLHVLCSWTHFISHQCPKLFGFYGVIVLSRSPNTWPSRISQLCTCSSLEHCSSWHTCYIHRDDAIRARSVSLLYKGVLFLITDSGHIIKPRTGTASLRGVIEHVSTAILHRVRAYGLWRGKECNALASSGTGCASHAA